MESDADCIEEKYNEIEQFPKKFFFKQVFVCTGIWIVFFMHGLVIGAPTVIIPHMRKHDSVIITDEMSSWLCSTYPYVGVPLVFLVPLVTYYFGRKLALLFTCLQALVGFIVLYFSTTTTQLLISEAILSVILSFIHTIAPLMITEYCSPRYRGLFLTIKSASIYWGIWVSNAIGTFIHWKYIAVLGVACSLNCVLIVFWPESPYWLATKNRIDECAAAHRWLKGTGEESHKELMNIIDNQKQIRDSPKKGFDIKEYHCKEFYMPLLFSFLTGLLYHSSGKLVCTVYAIEIVKKITKNETAAYQAMLILDGVTVFGMYVGCALSKILKRKVLLLTSASIGAMFLFILSLYLYLIKLSIIIENHFVTVSILMLFSLTISCGPMILSSSIYGELISQRYKTVSMTCHGVFTNVAMATALKIAPLIFKTFAFHGAFLFYSLSSSFFIFILYKYLPETKDKTVFEIEMLFKTEKT